MSQDEAQTHHSHPLHLDISGMGNSLERVERLTRVSPEELAATPPLEDLGMHAAELDREWELFFMAEAQDATCEEKKKLRATKASIKWAVLLRHHRDSAERFVDDGDIFFRMGETAIADALYRIGVKIKRSISKSYSATDASEPKFSAAEIKIREMEEMKDLKFDVSIPKEVFVIEGFKQFLV